MAGLKWNTGKLYYSTVELGYQHVVGCRHTYISHLHFTFNTYMIHVVSYWFDPRIMYNVDAGLVGFGNGNGLGLGKGRSSKWKWSWL